MRLRPGSGVCARRFLPFALALPDKERSTTTDLDRPGRRPWMTRPCPRPCRTVSVCRAQASGHGEIRVPQTLRVRQGTLLRRGLAFTPLRANRLGFGYRTGTPCVCCYCDNFTRVSLRSHATNVPPADGPWLAHTSEHEGTAVRKRRKKKRILPCSAHPERRYSHYRRIFTMDLVPFRLAS